MSDRLPEGYVPVRGLSWPERKVGKSSPHKVVIKELKALAKGAEEPLKRLMRRHTDNPSVVSWLNNKGVKLKWII